MTTEREKPEENAKSPRRRLIKIAEALGKQMGYADLAANSKEKAKYRTQEEIALEQAEERGILIGLMIATNHLGITDRANSARRKTVEQYSPKDSKAES